MGNPGSWGLALAARRQSVQKIWQRSPLLMAKKGAGTEWACKLVRSYSERMKSLWPTICFIMRLMMVKQSWCGALAQTGKSVWKSLFCATVTSIGSDQFGNQSIRGIRTDPVHWTDSPIQPSQARHNNYFLWQSDIHSIKKNHLFLFLSLWNVSVLDILKYKYYNMEMFERHHRPLRTFEKSAEAIAEEGDEMTIYGRPASAIRSRLNFEGIWSWGLCSAVKK